MYTHHFTPFNTPFTLGAFGFALPLLIALIAIVIILKGFALWHAARGSQKYWFIALLIINSIGILEIVYLLFFRPSAPYAHLVKSSHHTREQHHTPHDSSSAT